MEAKHTARPSKDSVGVEGDCISWVQLAKINCGLSTKLRDGHTGHRWRREQLGFFWTEQIVPSERMCAFTADKKVAGLTCSIFEVCGYCVVFFVGFDLPQTFAPLD